MGARTCPCRLRPAPLVLREQLPCEQGAGRWGFLCSHRSQGPVLPHTTGLHALASSPTGPRVRFGAGERDFYFPSQKEALLLSLERCQSDEIPLYFMTKLQGCFFFFFFTKKRSGIMLDFINGKSLSALSHQGRSRTRSSGGGWGLAGRFSRAAVCLWGFAPGREQLARASNHRGSR